MRDSTGSRESGPIAARAALESGRAEAWELFDKAGVSDSLESTAKKALQELVSAGLVQRIGKGFKGDPFLHFAAGDDPERTKRELADGQAIENAGRHLRGAR